MGEPLRGIVLFGSVARGVAREGSDVDLLIVLSPSSRVHRELYARWEEDELAQRTLIAEAGRRTPANLPLSPHFVRLPARARDVGSLWLEASMDGVVWYDPGGAVSRLLVEIRRMVAAGSFRRREAYGLAYWMREDEPGSDYLKRAGHRLKALETLMSEESWADVVREAQELVEITLKALLRSCGVEAPRIHDLSPILEQNQERLPPGIRDRLSELTGISRSLRRDRELAFYGSEDLTPSDFYTRRDAEAALSAARLVHSEVSRAMGST